MNKILIPIAFVLMFATVAFAQQDVSISYANTIILTNNTGEEVYTFSPTIGPGQLTFVPQLNTNYYYGVVANSTTDFPNVQWRINITSTGGISNNSVAVEEMGWYDTWSCSMNESQNPFDYPNCMNGSEPYNFTPIDSNTISAIGSVFSIGNEIFNNVDRINFANLNFGHYVVSRELLNADTGEVISNTLTIFYFDNNPLPPPPSGGGGNGGYVPLVSLNIEGQNELTIIRGDTKEITFSITPNATTTVRLTSDALEGTEISIMPSFWNVIQKDQSQDYEITFTEIAGTQSFTKTLAFSIAESLPPTPEPEPEQPPEQPKPDYTALIAIILVILAIGGYTYYKSRKSVNGKEKEQSE